MNQQMSGGASAPAAGEEHTRGWVHAMGLRVEVRAAAGAESPRLLSRLLEPWAEAEPVGAHAGQGAASGAAPAVDLGMLAETALEAIASTLSTKVTLAALETRCGSHLLFHAGGIADDTGAVVAIIGPSGRGKTTTVRSLARERGYVSDETVAITESGEVLPYRKPLSVITDGHSHKLQIAPSQLGLRPLPAARLHIAGLVLLDRRDDGRAEPSVTQVPLAEALVELVQQTSYLAELPHPLRRIAEVAEATGGVRRLLAGAPDMLSEAIPDLYAPGRCGSWRQVLPLGRGRRGAAREAAAGGCGAAAGREDADLGASGRSAVQTDGAADRLPYAAAPVLDAIECEDGTVVFTEDRQAQLLSGLGPVLWAGLCAGDGWKELEERVVGALGAPPGGEVREALAAACEALAQAGVLVRTGGSPAVEEG
ncbi:ATP-binding protein [Brevibacterium album]|uniref:ATP-binding protein n=1 Tax=Brevibacterium album TaxID=417948 RepID=UPI0012ECAC95|nr:ATP-binding protein [Brevibacterium album]